jgi:DNA polymerase-1
MRPLLAVDGDNLAHRAWHALPKSIKGGDGKPGNVIVGFLNMLVSVWEAEKPRTVLVAFDTVGEPTYRNELLPQYQAGREFPPELTNQLDRLPALVEALGFAQAKGVGYEADDFLAAAVAAEEARGGKTLVLTTDRDLFQLASSKTTVLRPRRGVSEIDRVGPAEVLEIYGVEPNLVPDFVALRGDPSDRIPGAPGVGPGRAAVILKTHGSLDAALENGGFPTIADDLRNYLRMTRLQYDAPIPDLPDAEPTWGRAAELVESWGHGALAERLRGRAA